jgi:hypothetical protein
MLPCRVHRQQAEIGTFAAQLHVYACGESGGIFSQLEIALVQHWLQNFSADSVALNEKTLRGPERHIDHTHDGRDVARNRPPNLYLVVHSCVARMDILSS